MTVPRPLLLLALVPAAAFAVPLGCSLDNQEGPLVTCEDLECGRINACADGIIAQCVDGRTVRYHVCGTDDVCLESWQVVGAFKCSDELTDCEGCRPERGGCDDLPPITGTVTGTGGASTTTTGSTGGASGTGGAGGSS